MKLRNGALLLLIPVALGACKKRHPAEPAPVADTTATTGRTGGDAARADSIRLADEARQRAAAEDRRRREAAVSAAREALTEIVFFEYDSDEIGATAEQRLQMKAAVLRDNPTVRLRIEGHADQRGSTEYNLALGQRRAEAVRAYLVNLGIEPSRFSTISYGKERPLVEGDSEDAYSRNRRAEFGVIGGEITTVPAELRR